MLELKMLNYLSSVIAVYLYVTDLKSPENIYC